MTVTTLPTAGRHGDAPRAHRVGLVSSNEHATSACGLVHDATDQLLAALEDAVTAAAAAGINDTGARDTAEALRDARLALDFAIIAAGRTLADRDVQLRVDHPAAAHHGVPA